MEKYDLILEIFLKIHFSDFCLKNKWLTMYLCELISQNRTNKSQKWLYQGLVEAST